MLHKPNYKLTSDLIKDKPNLVNACHLLLIWSFPNESMYDYEAIITLKPKYVTIVYETTGSAGGDKLHEFIASNNYKIIHREAHDHYIVRFKSLFNFELLFIEL